MSFDLQIEFVGLGLFVPHTGAKTVYVLMPAAGTGAHAGGIDPHVVRLCVDTAYLLPGSAGPNGVLALVAMDGMELSLGAAGTLDPGLPPELGNVGAVAERPISPVAFGSNPGSLLSARVKLRSGAYSEYARGVCWNYANKRQRLCNRVIWTVAGYEGERLELTGTPFGQDLAPLLPPLYPIEGAIQLSLYHTTRDELPPAPMVPEPPAPGTPAHHFSTFYELFDPPVADGPLPTYVGRSCDETGQGGSPYTCMGAQSPPAPEG
jgi:hypothetical protein